MGTPIRNRGCRGRPVMTELQVRSGDVVAKTEGFHFLLQAQALLAIMRRDIYNRLPFHALPPRRFDRQQELARLHTSVVRAKSLAYGFIFLYPFQPSNHYTG